MFIREGIGVWDTSVRQVGKTVFWKCFRHLTPFTHFVFTSLNSHVINSFSNLSPDFGLLDAVTLLNNISIGIDMTHNNVHIYLWDSLFCFCFFWSFQHCQFCLTWSFMGVTKCKSSVLFKRLVIYTWLTFTYICTRVRRKSAFAKLL